MRFELWWPFSSSITSGAVLKPPQTFSETLKVIMNHILEPWSNWNSPSEFAFTTKVMYCRIFCLKVVVKSSLPTWFLTKKYFFIFDFRMMNFTFLWPRNEIWKRLGVFWKLPNAFGANYASVLKKKWILVLKPSFLLVFTYTEPYTRWGLSYGGLSQVLSRRGLF